MLFFPPKKQFFEENTYGSVSHPSERHSTVRHLCDFPLGFLGRHMGVHAISTAVLELGLVQTPRVRNPKQRRWAYGTAAPGAHAITRFPAGPQAGVPARTPSRARPSRHAPWMVLLKKALQASQEATP